MLCYRNLQVIFDVFSREQDKIFIKFIELLIEENKDWLPVKEACLLKGRPERIIFSKYDDKLQSIFENFGIRFLLNNAIPEGYLVFDWCKDNFQLVWKN